ncbi:uncharacterized protein BYT42DRAFT_497206 [Radiomyces spectabilis]|uniref:uncharacterized protein n=1 Tax=Radiomyces spectabilis TaxID=64574 RepID=UPI00221FFFC4|nr:uncharacterized protein BYT42DRAFT_497206 [Radiomyces spectabilis]KAI8377982.1 hypothetical protein BYT42DRAFT_497206 [Radiomyces spectabilis]
MVVAGEIPGPDLMEAASEFVSLACITVLACALGAKTFGERFRTLNYGRALVILLYTLSWAFSTTSVIVVSTNNNNIVSCTLGMMACDIFYAGSKIVIYAWLIERVHLVTAVKTTRMKTCQYRFHILLLCPYMIIFGLMISFSNIYLESSGQCTIGLQPIASIPLLVYDFCFNLYLTWLFMKPLMAVGRNSRTNWKQSNLFRLARRTLVASLVSLLVSFLNVLLVVISQGHERGLVCLTMCTVDVTINVITVHWVTNNAHSSNGDRTKGAHTVDHITAEMTFDGGMAAAAEKTNAFKMPVVRPKVHNYDDDSNKSMEINIANEKPT